MFRKEKRICINVKYQILQKNFDHKIQYEKFFNIWTLWPRSFSQLALNKETNKSFELKYFKSWEPFLGIAEAQTE